MAALTNLTARHAINTNGWLGLFSAAALGEAATVVRAHFRGASELLMAQLAASEQLQRALVIEHEETARKLAASQENLRRVFDSTLDSILVGRFEDGVITSMNQAFEQFGYTREATIGTAALRLGLWADPADRDEFRRRLAVTGVVQNLEFKLRRSEGALVPVLVSATLIDLDSTPSVVSIIRDITSIKQTERDLIAAREAALAASRAKSEFLSTMSHEIRTPMNLILGSAELLAESQLDPQQRTCLSVMQNNGNSLLRLLSDILDLAKVESGRLTLEQSAFDLAALIGDAAEAMAMRAHAEGLELVTRIAPDVPCNLLGDALRIRQILINLVGNAIKFTEHGDIVIGVTRDQGSLDVSPSEAATNDHVILHFSVRDTGIGIPPDHLEGIFANFTQVDSSTARNYGGSGLGLAIVRRMVELMGGKVWAESTPGFGSTFHFTLRFGLAGTTAPAIARAAAIAAKVLVIDHNEASRDSLREIIASQLAAVEVFASGEEGLARAVAATAEVRPFDTILVDSGMSTDDNFALAQKLSQLHSPTGKVIMMLKANDLNSDLARIRDLGITAYLVKPIRRSELLNTIADRAQPQCLATGEPSRQANPPKSANGKPSGAIQADRALRILLTDDSVDNRMLLKAYFRRLPYEVDEAENGAIALEKFTNSDYDLVLMDLQMPVMDGWSAIRAMREHESSRQPHTPIIALTASALGEDMHKSLEAGADAFVTKPVTKTLLLEAIRNVTGTSADAPGTSHAA
jgi:PAS domain S-box-containing protein